MILITIKEPNENIDYDLAMTEDDMNTWIERKTVVTEDKEGIEVISQLKEIEQLLNNEECRFWNDTQRPIAATTEGKSKLLTKWAREDKNAPLPYFKQSGPNSCDKRSIGDPRRIEPYLLDVFTEKTNDLEYAKNTLVFKTYRGEDIMVEDGEEVWSWNM
ncbi:hypothetical protein RFI_12365, partial [Reticulomyxa filosa]